MSSNESLPMMRDMQPVLDMQPVFNMQPMSNMQSVLNMHPITSMIEEHGFVPFEPSDNPALHHLATDPALKNEYMPEDWTGFTKAAEKEFRARVQSLGVDIRGINGIPIPQDMPLLWMKARRANQLYTYDKHKDLVYLLSHHPPPSWIRIRTGLLADFARPQTVIPQVTPTSDNVLAAEQGQYISYQLQEYMQTMSNRMEMPQDIALFQQNDGAEQGSTTLSDNPQDPSPPASGWMGLSRTMLFSTPSVGVAQSDEHPLDPNYFCAFPHEGVSPSAHQRQAIPETSNSERENHNEVSDIRFLEASETYDEHAEITAAAIKAANDQGALV
ncbi:hypothetical protein PTMSG1_04842 [Pyrenophora teres f. maculata]|nr:hypothetical protein PTMSG1_04842 [Pyrenophora teres f. maculata]